MSSSSERPGIVGTSHLGLTVRDLDASVRWYRDVLGLVPLDGARRAESSRYQLLVHGESGFAVGLREHDAGDGSTFDETHTGLDHFAFLVESTQALEAWAARFEELGVEHSPIASTDYGQVLVFRDPDNIQLEMFVSPLQLATIRLEA